MKRSKNEHDERYGLLANPEDLETEGTGNIGGTFFDPMASSAQQDDKKKQKKKEQRNSQRGDANNKDSGGGLKHVLAKFRTTSSGNRATTSTSGEAAAVKLPSENTTFISSYYANDEDDSSTLQPSSEHQQTQRREAATFEDRDRSPQYHHRVGASTANTNTKRGNNDEDDGPVMRAHQIPDAPDPDSVYDADTLQDAAWEEMISGLTSEKKSRKVLAASLRASVTTAAGHQTHSVATKSAGVGGKASDDDDDGKRSTQHAGDEESHFLPPSVVATVRGSSRGVTVHGDEPTSESDDDHRHHHVSTSMKRNQRASMPPLPNDEALQVTTDEIDAIVLDNDDEDEEDRHRRPRYRPPPPPPAAPSHHLRALVAAQVVSSDSDDDDTNGGKRKRGELVFATKRNRAPSTASSTVVDKGDNGNTPRMLEARSSKKRGVTQMTTFGNAGPDNDASLSTTTASDDDDEGNVEPEIVMRLTGAAAWPSIRAAEISARLVSDVRNINSRARISCVPVPIPPVPHQASPKNGDDDDEGQLAQDTVYTSEDQNRRRNENFRCRTTKRVNMVPQVVTVTNLSRHPAWKPAKTLSERWWWLPLLLCLVTSCIIITDLAIASVASMSEFINSVLGNIAFVLQGLVLIALTLQLLACSKGVLWAVVFSFEFFFLVLAGGVYVSLDAFNTVQHYNNSADQRGGVDANTNLIATIFAISSHSTSNNDGGTSQDEQLRRLGTLVFIPYILVTMFAIATALAMDAFQPAALIPHRRAKRSSLFLCVALLFGLVNISWRFLKRHHRDRHDVVSTGVFYVDIRVTTTVEWAASTLCAFFLKYFYRVFSSNQNGGGGKTASLLTVGGISGGESTHEAASDRSEHRQTFRKDENEFSPSPARPHHHHSTQRNRASSVNSASTQQQEERGARHRFMSGYSTKTDADDRNRFLVAEGAIDREERLTNLRHQTTRNHKNYCALLRRCLNSSTEVLQDMNFNSVSELDEWVVVRLCIVIPLKVFVTGIDPSMERKLEKQRRERKKKDRLSSPVAVNQRPKGGNDDSPTRKSGGKDDEKANLSVQSTSSLNFFAAYYDRDDSPPAAANGSSPSPRGESERNENKKSASVGDAQQQNDSVRSLGSTSSFSPPSVRSSAVFFSGGQRRPRRLTAVDRDGKTSYEYFKLDFDELKEHFESLSTEVLDVERNNNTKVNAGRAMSPTRAAYGSAALNIGDWDDIERGGGFDDRRHLLADKAALTEQQLDIAKENFLAFSDINIDTKIVPGSLVHFNMRQKRTFTPSTLVYSLSPKPLVSSIQRCFFPPKRMVAPTMSSSSASVSTFEFVSAASILAIFTILSVFNWTRFGQGEDVASTAKILHLAMRCIGVLLNMVLWCGWASRDILSLQMQSLEFWYVLVQLALGTLAAFAFYDEVFGLAVAVAQAVLMATTGVLIASLDAMFSSGSGGGKLRANCRLSRGLIYLFMALFCAWQVFYYQMDINDNSLAYVKSGSATSSVDLGLYQIHRASLGQITAFTLAVMLFRFSFKLLVLKHHLVFASFSLVEER